jgi:tetratricopeptide (TPR) repeat protein
MPESEPLPEAAETPDIPTPIEEPPESVVAESAPVPEAADVPDVPTSIEEAPADVKPSSSHKLSEEQAAEKLATARIALESGDVQTAANEYQALIRAKYHLNEVIDTLQRALERYPNTPILWQVLGDAHMKADQLTDAMDAYRQGLDTI